MRVLGFRNTSPSIVGDSGIDVERPIVADKGSSCRGWQVTDERGPNFRVRPGSARFSRSASRPGSPTIGIWAR